MAHTVLVFCSVIPPYPVEFNLTMTVMSLCTIPVIKRLGFQENICHISMIFGKASKDMCLL